MSPASDRPGRLAAAGPSIRITDLATLTGTTVRALRHYEDLGLLRPLRSPARVRLYTPAAADTARRIVAMRRIGVPASAIADVLDALNSGRDEPMQAILRNRLQALEDQVRLVKNLLEDQGPSCALKRPPVREAPLPHPRKQLAVNGFRTRRT